MITNILINKVLFIIQIFIAEALFTFSLKKRSYFALRSLGSVVLCIAIAILFPVPFDNAIYSSFMFFTLFAITVALLLFCYKEHWLSLVFCGIAAYTVQHFSYMFANLVSTLINQSTSSLLGMYHSTEVDISSFSVETLLAVLIFFLCMYTFYGAFYFLFGKRIQKNGSIEIRSSWLLLLVAVGLFVDIIINTVYVYHLSVTDFGVNVMICIYGCICCFLLLAVQFELIMVKQIEMERDFATQMWNEEKKQYQLFQENIDIINLKCHDIRHQIREIGETKQIEKETMDEIEKSIAIYDLGVETGHKTIDIILTEKSLRCHKNNITFSCVADGERLKFMSDADIYSLFGNALDNAIEAVTQLGTSEDRVIGLTLRAVGQMTSLNIYNSYNGNELDFKNDLPITTKGGSMFHGFGVRSIKIIVEKYGGNMSISAKNGVFSLDILFPQTIVS